MQSSTFTMRTGKSVTAQSQKDSKLKGLLLHHTGIALRNDKDRFPKKFHTDAPYIIQDNDLLNLSQVLNQSHHRTLEQVCINIDKGESFKWTQVGAEAVGESLKNHPTLRVVEIKVVMRWATDEFHIDKERAILGFLNCLESTPVEYLSLSLDRVCIPSFLNCAGEYLQKTRHLKVIKIEGSLRIEESKDKDPKLLQPFAAGLGAQKNLQTLSLKDVPLGDSGIQEIRKTMQEMTSLKSMSFDHCHIKKAVDQIYFIALDNPSLEVLSVKSNQLGEEGVNKLVRTLPFPSFRNLKELNLSDTGLNDIALNNLVSTVREYELNIVSLDISSNEINEASLDSLIKLIDKNFTLKKLSLCSCGIDDLKLIKLSSILMDPARCQLERVHFIGDKRQAFSVKTYNMLSTVLRKNEFLYELLPDFFLRYTNELRALCHINKTKKFLRETSIIITALDFIMPFPLILLVLSYAALEMHNTKANNSTKLINDTLKKNAPKNNEDVIHPNLMEFKDILFTLTPFLDQAIPYTDKPGFKIDLSNLAPERQRYIRDVWAHYFEITFHYYPDTDIPTAEINEKENLLTIQRISLPSLIKEMNDDLNPPGDSEPPLTEHMNHPIAPLQLTPNPTGETVRQPTCRVM